MANLLERLADLDVPPPPAQFDRQLHQRVNRTLVVSQFVDLAVSGLPWALMQFGRAVIGLILFTITGRYEKKPKERRR